MSSSKETMTELLEAGVHYGHQTKRWNPKMKDFILEEKNSIYIIDLSITVDQLDKAADFLGGIVKGNGKVLFVGTKKQAQEAIKEAAEATGQYFVNQRWLGGTLTNLQTIRRSVARFREFQEMEKTLGVRKTDLVRNGLLKNSRSVIINAKELIGQLEKAGAEIGRSGNNINQLARYANMLNKKDILSPVVAERFNILLGQYLDNQKGLETVLRKIIRMMIQ